MGWHGTAATTPGQAAAPHPRRRTGLGFGNLYLVLLFVTRRRREVRRAASGGEQRVKRGAEESHVQRLF